MSEQAAALGQSGLAMAVRQEAVVPDALEAWGKSMEKEAAQEFGGGEGHDTLAVAVAVVLPKELDRMVILAEEALVGDGDSVRVTPEIFKDLAGPSEGWFGVNDPVCAGKGAKIVVPVLRVLQGGQGAVKGKLVLFKGVPELFKKQPPEQAREDSDGKEETLSG